MTLLVAGFWIPLHSTPRLEGGCGGGLTAITPILGFWIRSLANLFSPSTSVPLTSSSLSYSSESSYLEVVVVISSFFSSRFDSSGLSVATYMAFMGFCYCVLMRLLSAGKGLFI